MSLVVKYFHFVFLESYMKQERVDATMRIAMVGHKRVPSREGGIEVVVEELAARMVMHGHSVTCYNRTGHHVSGKEYDIEHLDEFSPLRSSISAPPLGVVSTTRRKNMASSSTMPKISYSVGSRKKSACW